MTSVIKIELLHFEIGGKRGSNLEGCYQDLNSISLASVECERVFLRFNKIATKIRSTFNDESLDIFSLLRYYFKSENLKFE